MYDIVRISGDGIGPEITNSVCRILETAKVQINWIDAVAGEAVFNETGNPLPDDTI